MRLVLYTSVQNSVHGPAMCFSLHQWRRAHGVREPQVCLKDEKIFCIKMLEHVLE